MLKPCRLPEPGNVAETPPKTNGLKLNLLADAKERAEHIMLVDLGRNDLGRVCEFGSVKVTDLNARRTLQPRDAHRLER